MIKPPLEEDEASGATVELCKRLKFVGGDAKRTAFLFDGREGLHAYNVSTNLTSNMDQEAECESMGVIRTTGC